MILFSLVSTKNRFWVLHRGLMLNMLGVTSALSQFGSVGLCISHFNRIFHTLLKSEILLVSQIF